MKKTFCLVSKEEAIVSIKSYQIQIRIKTISVLNYIKECNRHEYLTDFNYFNISYVYLFQG